MVEVASQATFDRYDADFDLAIARETASPAGKFIATSKVDGNRVQATLAIDTLDCIGCGMCIAKCPNNVLKQVDGKAMVDLQRLHECDLNGECVRTCPTQVVQLRIEPLNATDGVAKSASA
jgi:ferredoxin